MVPTLQRGGTSESRLTARRADARRSFRGSRLTILLAACLMALVHAAQAQKKPPPRPLDLNTATVEQLEQLPGIGPATAQAIVRFREKSRPFERSEDLLAIHGICKSRFDKIRPYITVNQPAKPHS